MLQTQPGPGQESVWDYPVIPRVEVVHRRIRVVFDGQVIADSTGAVRVIEISHPPVYYVPMVDVRMERLLPGVHRTICEYKGEASYFDVVIGEHKAYSAAWTYAEPLPGYEALREMVAFYAQKMDACYVDDELVSPQAGHFYGGWITKDIAGPFKGTSGSLGW
ncbi:MAG: DUF427 domain-containing protein [Coriobacteriia bacterium]|nr:DUF427 domain-containing protein [Coriobacteriia bacterium]